MLLLFRVSFSKLDTSTFSLGPLSIPRIAILFLQNLSLSSKPFHFFRAVGPQVVFSNYPSLSVNPQGLTERDGYVFISLPRLPSHAILTRGISTSQLRNWYRGGLRQHPGFHQPCACVSQIRKWVGQHTSLENAYQFTFSSKSVRGQNRPDFEPQNRSNDTSSPTHSMNV